MPNVAAVEQESKKTDTTLLTFPSVPASRPSRAETRSPLPHVTDHTERKHSQQRESSNQRAAPTNTVEVGLLTPIAADESPSENPPSDAETIRQLQARVRELESQLAAALRSRRRTLSDPPSYPHRAAPFFNGGAP